MLKWHFVQSIHVFVDILYISNKYSEIAEQQLQHFTTMAYDCPFTQQIQQVQSKV